MSSNAINEIKASRKEMEEIFAAKQSNDVDGDILALISGELLVKNR